MALVQNVVEQYHGTVSVETEAGEGTCITVSFAAEIGYGRDEREDVSRDNC